MQFQKAVETCERIAMGEDVPQAQRQSLSLYLNTLSAQTTGRLNKALRHRLEIRRREGCVALKKARSTKLLVGLYRSAEGGIESDEKLPWSTVCEEHGGVVCHPSRADAEAAMSCPEDWCPTCSGQESV